MSLFGKKEIAELRAALAVTRREAALNRRQMESAATHRLNRGHWGAVPSSGPVDALLLPDLAITRTRCIWECLNSGYSAGIQRSHYEDCIGPAAPGLQIQVALPEKPTDAERAAAEKFTRRVERVYRAWALNPDLRRQLGLVDLLQQADALNTCAGEYFIQKVTDSTYPGPFSLRLLAIHPARVVTPPDKLADPFVRNGIRVDANGAPQTYYVAKQLTGLPGSSPAWSPTDFYEVPAEFMIHGYAELFPGQSRGWPRMAPTLGLGALLRDFTAATLEAADQAAGMAVLLENTDPNGQSGAPTEGETPVVEMQPRQIVELDPFLKPHQMKPEHPSTTFEMFNRIMLGALGRPFGMPYFKVALDSSSHNYSSVRMDNQSYWKGIECDQRRFERQLLNPHVLAELVRELVLREDLVEPADWSATWQWPQPEHVDPLKEAVAAETRKRIGTTTDAEEIGPHWEEVYAQQARELAARWKALQAAGLPPEVIMAQLTASAGAGGAALASALLAAQEAAEAKPASGQTGMSAPPGPQKGPSNAEE